MKNKRLIRSGVLAALVVAFVISIIPRVRYRAEWRRTVAALQNLPRDRVDAAAQAFKSDHKTAESAVSFRELISGDYLRAEEVGVLADRDASISFSEETNPQMVWIRVRAGDGSDIVQLNDGSIQKVTKP